MFGTAFNYSEPSSDKRHESVFESFYRPRLTQSIDLGPDVEVSIHSTYATTAYTTTLLSMRMRIIFQWANARRLSAASLTVALLVWSRWRRCNRQMPTAQYGHDSEPEAQECTHDHDCKGRVVQAVFYHHHNAAIRSCLQFEQFKVACGPQTQVRAPAGVQSASHGAAIGCFCPARPRNA
jgi:hypothetical protein